MEIKEAEISTVVADKDQLLDAYPDLFDEIPFGITKIHIERLFNDKLLDGKDRILVLPSGVISIKTEDEEMTNLHKKNTEFFTEVNAFVGNIQDKYIDNDSINLNNNLTIDDTLYSITLFPYKIAVAGENLMSRIESKMHSLRGNP